MGNDYMDGWIDFEDFHFSLALISSVLSVSAVQPGVPVVHGHTSFFSPHPPSYATGGSSPCCAAGHPSSSRPASRLQSVLRLGSHWLLSPGGLFGAPPRLFSAQPSLPSDSEKAPSSASVHLSKEVLAAARLGAVTGKAAVSSRVQVFTRTDAGGSAGRRPGSARATLDLGSRVSGLEAAFISLGRAAGRTASHGFRSCALVKLLALLPPPPATASAREERRLARLDVRSCLRCWCSDPG